MESTLIEARRLLTQATYGFLGTTRSGLPASRLCEHLAVDDDLTIWIGTSRSSRKVTEIDADPAVVYAVEDRAGLGYIATMGRAALDTTPEQCAALWRPHLLRFFPDGPNGDDFTLLRIVVHQVELMSFAAGLHPEPLGLRSVTITKEGHTWTPPDP